jgi:DNA-binding beta-propeller fold protein YncE
VSLTRRCLLALPALAACSPKRGTGFRGYAIIALEESRAVAFVDLAAFAVRARVPLDGPPLQLAEHRNLGPVYALTPSTVREIDVRNRAAARKAALRGAPKSMRISADGKTLWVLCSSPDTLVPVDTARCAVSRPISLPASPVDFDLSPVAPLATATLADGSLAIVSLERGAVQSRLPLSSALGAVRFRSDGRLILVADQANRQLTAVDATAGSIVVQLPLALRPDHLCMKPDGGQLFLTGEGRDAIVIAYPYRTEVAQTSLSGRAPGAMAASSGPDFLFVANPAGGSVTIFNIDTQHVVAVTAVGSQPGEIVITPDQQYALVLNRGSGDMAVIRIAAIQAGRSKSAALFTMVPVGARPVSTIVRGV